MYNTKQNKGKKRTDTETPCGLCEFLYKTISEHYDPQCILDPCCGDKRLTRLFNTDTINYEIKEGTDFLLETKKLSCDMVIINPPFNIGKGAKLSPEVFMDKILELCPSDIPIFLITPMGYRLNQKCRSKRWKKMRDTYPPIHTIISLPLNIFDDTLYHCEVIGYNCKLLQPHYFLPEEFLQ